MTYDPKTDYAYDESLTPDENRDNLRARYTYLYKWARDNWTTSCHAGGAEARAQYLECCSWNDDDQLDVDEIDGWDLVEGWLEDYAMVEILDDMIEDGSIYLPEEKRGYGQNGYGWMLAAVGYDINGSMDYIKRYLDKYDYDRADEVKAIIAKDYYDMWDDTL